MSTIAHGPILAAAASVLANPGLSLHATAKADVPTLPAGFPARLLDELAWTGSQYSKTSNHIFVLDDTHHAEIKAALESYKCKHSLPSRHPLLALFANFQRSSWSRRRPRRACQLPASDARPQAQGAQW
jgi:hypothetical protein